MLQMISALPTTPVTQDLLKRKNNELGNDFIHFNNLFFITSANGTVSVFERKHLGGEKQSNVLEFKYQRRGMKC